MLSLIPQCRRHFLTKVTKYTKNDTPFWYLQSLSHNISCRSHAVSAVKSFVSTAQGVTQDNLGGCNSCFIAREKYTIESPAFCNNFQCYEGGRVVQNRYVDKRRYSSGTLTIKMDSERDIRPSTGSKISSQESRLLAPDQIPVIVDQFKIIWVKFYQVLEDRSYTIADKRNACADLFREIGIWKHNMIGIPKAFKQVYGVVLKDRAEFLKTISFCGLIKSCLYITITSLIMGSERIADHVQSDFPILPKFPEANTIPDDTDKEEILLLLNDIIVSLGNLSEATKKRIEVKWLVRIFANFPLLRALDVDMNVLHVSIEKLIETGGYARTDAIRLYSLFQQKLGPTSIGLKLVNALMEDKNYLAVINFVVENYSNRVGAGTDAVYIDNTSEFTDMSHSDGSNVSNAQSTRNSLLSDETISTNLEWLDHEVEDTGMAEERSISDIFVQQERNAVPVIVNTVLAYLVNERTNHSFKCAMTLSTAFNMMATMNQIKDQYVECKIEFFVADGLWRLALERVTSSFKRQKILFTALVKLKLFSQAKEVQQKFPQLIHEYGAISDKDIESQARYERETYLQLPASLESNILIVNTADSLEEAINTFQLHRFLSEMKFLKNSIESLNALESKDVALVVGIDTEWSAFSPYSDTPKWHGVCTIQISTISRNIIFDLISLYGCDSFVRNKALDVLQTIFCRPDIIKVAWQFESSDIHMVRQTADGFFSPAFANMQGVLPLQELVYSHRSYDVATGKSLSAACHHFLGKPLNKIQQMSDWQCRPLTFEQMKYAALDAFVTLKILAEIMKGSSEFIGQETSITNKKRSKLQMAIHSMEKIRRAEELGMV